MRTLLLMRHAKSSWDQPELADLDRPLAPRGREAAPEVARYLAEHGLIPELVLGSPALRVRETWRLMAPVLGEGVPCKTLRSLYEGAPSHLLEALRQVDGEVRTLMLIGHNPALGALAQSLAGGGPEKTLDHLRTKFPTAAVAVLAFEIEAWADLGAGCGRLQNLVRPKDLH
jgi:phosphohistidine phosphatase